MTSLLAAACIFGAYLTALTDSPQVAPAVKHRHTSVRLPVVVQPPRHGHRQPRLAVTAYCATGRRNAAGHWPTVGTVAGNAWPLGTRLRVESVGVVTVEDRSAAGATDVDLYLGSDAGCAARAVAWGRRYLRVGAL